MKTSRDSDGIASHLLVLLTDIYLHLDSDVFVLALAADERSFRFELFEETALHLKNDFKKDQLQVLLIFFYIFIHCSFHLIKWYRFQFGRDFLRKL